MIDHAKAEALKAMYASVDRMNNAVVDGNQDVYQSEVGLQQNIRSNFEELLEEN
jgi:hypothetical protein